MAEVCDHESIFARMVHEFGIAHMASCSSEALVWQQRHGAGGILPTLSDFAGI
jgi:hypothetical protein